MKVEEVVPAALAGERLDRIVSLIADVSRSDASALVEAGGAEVDGSIAVAGKIRLSEGQRVVIDLGKIPVVDPPAPDSNVQLDVVHEDGDIVVVNKVAGMVVHPAPGHPGATVVNGLLARYPEISAVGDEARPGIVHRLDAGTTGLMVVARSQMAYESLVEALSGHDVGREYLALVWGHLDAPTMVVDAPIGRDPRDPLRMAVVNDGKWARTHVARHEEFRSPVNASLVRCSLETGRTHQIRVHLSAIGHPVVGDATYGGARNGLAASRPMLHAERLSLRHPRTGEPMSWTAPMPADMEDLVAQMSTENDE